MISDWLCGVLARRGIHYGWAMVAVTFLTALITAASVGAPGIFIVPMQMGFGWNTLEISSALSIRFVLFGLMAPFAAALMNRYGLRTVTITAILVIMVALLMSLSMTKVWQLVALWGVAVGIGAGMTARSGASPPDPDVWRLRHLTGEGSGVAGGDGGVRPDRHGGVWLAVGPVR